MNGDEAFVDIHCHLVPGIDDGAKSWAQSLAMARIAVAEGIRTVVATPRQLGEYSHNRSSLIRSKTEELQRQLDAHKVPLQVFPGANVRVQRDLIEQIDRGEVVTLADRGTHVLLDLPNELYVPIDTLLLRLSQRGITGILSHAERNQGLIKEPRRVEQLVDSGCLIQVSCGSLLGAFGPAPRHLAEFMLRHGLVHFLATEAHGSRSRRPLMQRAAQRVIELVGEAMATDICCRFPAAVVSGEPFEGNRHRIRSSRGFWSRVFPRRTAA